MKTVKIKTSEIDNYMSGMAAARTKAIMKFNNSYELTIDSHSTKYIITN